jgi:hypothetical protein
MEAKENRIAVSVGIFSGRPNPVIHLSGAGAEEFARLVTATIGKEPIHAPPLARLGQYYGFLVQMDGQSAKQLSVPIQLNVYLGVVSEGTGREQKHWRDVGNVERFLIEYSYSQGQGELLERVGIGRPGRPK